MALRPGTRLGPYEVLSALGAGGMGEVWRARDPRLGRDVALKVLPAAFVADPERLARFEREAKVLASLNHPHIGGIYGLEEADGGAVKALVLELVEGPTLADRIARGPIPVDEALPIARQIAEALEAAHEQGVIHRDLKPANIKVRPDGSVKVLDFGLAKAFKPQLQAADADLSHRPTLSLSAAATQMGMILGTAAYMAPEQARGRPVDKRADIWAFGCVLYEMLAGRRAFEGGDINDTLAAVLRSEPGWGSLRPSTPPSMLRLLRRCLEKAPEKRLRDIGDARLELEEVLTSGTGRGDAALESRDAAERRPAASAFAVLVGTSALALGLLVGFVVGRRVDRTSDARSPVDARPRPATRTEVPLPATAPLALGMQSPPGFDSPTLALSPDGRHLVYVGQAGEGTRLYHRDLTRLDEPRPLPGTEGAHYAFFDPTGEELGFLTQDRVKKIALDGGAPTSLCRARAPVMAVWRDDTIYFSESQGTVLATIPEDPEAGGEPEEIFDSFQRLGHAGSVTDVLPGGRAAFVKVVRGSADQYEIWVVSLTDQANRVLPITGFDARYLPSGHLVFGRGGRLLAAGFDLERLEMRGEPVPVLESVAMESIFGWVQAAFAENGTVALVPGADLARGRVAWVDRRGDGGLLDVPENLYGVLDLAADDRTLAVQVSDVRDYVWIWDAENGGRALPARESVGWPVWSPDGRSLAVSSWTAEGTEVVICDLDGQVTQRVLPVGIEVRTPDSWPQPDRVAFTVIAPSGVGVVNPLLPGAPVWVRHDATGVPLGTFAAALSPDARWIAYSSTEGIGEYEVWIQEIDGGIRRQLSTDGGLEPVWCRKCDEVFYRQGNRILARRVTVEPELAIGPSELAFEAPDFVDTKGISFRVSSDGQRMYYVRRSQPPVRDRVHIVHHWFDELERRLPVN